MGRSPSFYGIGTDRSPTIVAAASGAHGCGEWSEHALSNLPSELRETYFVEVAEPAAARVQRLAREALGIGVGEPPPRRFGLVANAREACQFIVEDAAAGPPAPDEEASVRAGVETGTSLGVPSDAASGGPRYAASGGPSGVPMVQCKLEAVPCREGGGAPRPDDLVHHECYDVILCRYSIFLYADADSVARRALRCIVSRLAPGGILLLGQTDPLPQCAAGMLERVPEWSMTDATLSRASGCHRFERPAQPINAWRLKAAPADAGYEAEDRGTPASAVIGAISNDGGGGGGGGGRDGGGEGGRGGIDGGSMDGGVRGDAWRSLEGAMSLRQFRRSVGLRASFAAPSTPYAAPCWTSVRSKAILAEKGAPQEPLAERAAAYARERHQRLEALRAEKLEAEEMELLQARRALRARLSAYAASVGSRPNGGRTKHRLGGVPSAGGVAGTTSAMVAGHKLATVSRAATPATSPTALPFVERSQRLASAKQARIVALEQATQTMYNQRWGIVRKRAKIAQ